MKPLIPRALASALLVLFLSAAAWGSAYDGRPKLVVVVIVDQMRGDYLERYRDRFAENGFFRMFLDRGAVFTDCHYQYASTRTSPGNATLLSGTYVPGHSIIGNEWWDPQQGKAVLSVEDAGTRLLGVEGRRGGASPVRLTASTLGDELKLATEGKARVFSVSLKDTASVLSGGRAADAAYWLDRRSDAFVTSSYYMQQAPEWVTRFNAARPAEQYWDREWKDESGKVLRNTTPPAGKPRDFYRVVGKTPYGTDYTLDFARELVSNEKLGSGPATDLLVLGISAPDALGHEVGPEAPEMAAMMQAIDRQLAEFFTFLGKQVGLANVWIALSADHGSAPLPRYARQVRLPGHNFEFGELRAAANAELSKRFRREANYIGFMREWPFAFLAPDAFQAAGVSQEDAEKAAGEVLQRMGRWRGFVTASQLARGQGPADELGRRYANSYAPDRGWFVIGIGDAHTVGFAGGTDHSTPYSYDTHVPLAFFGLAFRPGIYRKPAEPVDLAVTLSSLLGINPPTHAVGRVLTEALAPPREAGR